MKLLLVLCLNLCISRINGVASNGKTLKFLRKSPAENSATQPAWISEKGELMIPDETVIVSDSELPSISVISMLDNIGKKNEIIDRNSVVREQISDVSSARSSRSSLLVPSPVKPNGSDVFIHDIFEPNLDFSSEKFNHSTGNVSEGCFYKEDNPAYLICNGSTIQTLPAQLPPQLIVFELNTTQVNTLPSKAFSNITVQIMKLNANEISNISSGAFHGINGLLYLSLERNRLISLDFSDFEELSTLAVLLLRDNRINLARNGWRIEYNKTVLPSLTYLDLGGNPLGSLNQYVFWNLRESPLEELNLQSCGLQYVHPDSLRSLKQLKHVDFFDNPGLKTMSSLTYFPRLRQVGLASLQLESIPSSVLEILASTLFALNLSGNYFLRLSKDSIPDLPLLSILVLENCGIYSIQEGSFKHLSNLKYLYLGKNKLRELPFNIFPPSVAILSMRQNPDTGNGNQFFLGSYRLREMANLTWLDLESTDIQALESYTFFGLEKLRVLQVRSAGLMNIKTMAFAGLGNLWILDLGENPGLELLQSHSFNGLANLKYLFLDRCNIDFPRIFSPKRIRVQGIPEFSLPFSTLKNLEQLFINNNNIHHFHLDLIANLTSLLILDLSYNKITDWDSNTTQNMVSNGSLNLSNNRISYLQNGTFAEFSRLAAIDLSDNNFILHCELRDLLMLANTTNVMIRNWDNYQAYTCIDSVTQEIRPVQTLTYEDLGCNKSISDETYPLNMAAILIPVFVVSAALFVTVLTCYCKRWYVRYTWTMMRMKTRRFKHSKSQSEEFEYDAFVSFSENDRNWVYTYLVPQLEGGGYAVPRKIHMYSGSGDESKTNQLGSFRLCLHDRDFVAGQRITENIIENITRSRKVLVVMSRSYLQSKWCQYELHLAQHRLLEEHRGDLILILLENIPKNEQSKNVRYLLKTRTYLAWCHDIEGQHFFWRRLSHVLRKTCLPEQSVA